MDSMRTGDRSMGMSDDRKSEPARRKFMRGVAATMALPVVQGIGSARKAEAAAAPQAAAASLVGASIPDDVLRQTRLPDSIIEGFRALRDDVASICSVLWELGLQNCIDYRVKPMVEEWMMCGSAR